MSTAYPPRFVKYMFSSKKERNAARASTMSPGYYGKFTFPLGLYYVGPGQDFLSERFVLSTINLQEPASQKQDLHGITFHKGPGILQMTLYSTTDNSGPPIAIAKNDHRYSSSTDITLPGPQGEGQITERLQYGAIASNSFTFNINGETYRWRRDKAKSPKIMRLVKNPVTTTSAEGNEVYEVGAQPEILATWTEGSVPNRDYRIAIFTPSSSDTFDKLGEYGTLLAVSSGLVICQRGAAIEGENFHVSISLRARADFPVGTMAWYEETKLEKRYYEPVNAS